MHRTEQNLGLGGSLVGGGVTAGAAAARRRRRGWSRDARRTEQGRARRTEPRRAQLELGLVAGALQIDAMCARAGGGVRTSWAEREKSPLNPSLRYLYPPQISLNRPPTFPLLHSLPACCSRLVDLGSGHQLNAMRNARFGVQNRFPAAPLRPSSTFIPVFDRLDGKPFNCPPRP